MWIRGVGARWECAQVVLAKSEQIGECCRSLAHVEPGPTTKKAEALVTTRALLRVEETDGLDAALPLLQSRVGLWTGHAATRVLTISVRRRHDCL